MVVWDLCGTMSAHRVRTFDPGCCNGVRSQQAQQSMISSRWVSLISSSLFSREQTLARRRLRGGVASGPRGVVFVVITTLFPLFLGGSHACDGLVVGGFWAVIVSWSTALNPIPAL